MQESFEGNSTPNKFRVDDLGMTEVVLKDFQNSWEYYKFNLEERREIVARIYNFIGFPVFAIALILYYIDNKILLFPSSNQQGPDISFLSYTLAALILTFLSAYGTLQIIALAIESRVSRDYLHFLNNVRQYVGLIAPELRPFLKFNPFEAQVQLFLTGKDFESARQFAFNSEIALQLEAAYRKPRPKRGLVGYLLSVKGSYWRSSSAILIVAVALGGAVAVTFKAALPAYADATSMTATGAIVSLGSFMIGSWLFDSIANK